jgi:hypothetical protein
MFVLENYTKKIYFCKYHNKIIFPLNFPLWRRAVLYLKLSYSQVNMAHEMGT